MRNLLPILLVASLGLTGFSCAVPKHMRSARDHQAAGQDYRAANEYLFVLDRRPNHGDAAFGLIATAEPGYRKRLATAQTQEANGNFRKAASTYDELARYTHRLKVHGVLDFDIPDLASMASQMREAAVAADFRAGEVALSRGDYAVAFQKFESVKGERPSWPGLDLALAKTWYGSARDNEEGHQYRAAVDQYEGADQAFGRRYEDARDRAGVLMTALGRYHYQRGNCRQAWRDLKRADRLDQERSLSTEVQDAWDCAVTHVVVEPTQLRFGSDVDGIDVAGMLRDGTITAVERDKSDFVRLLQPEQRGLADFSLQISLTEAWADTNATTTRQATQGTRAMACATTNELGEEVLVPCDETVEVLYEEVVIESAAQLVGKVELQHRKTRVRSRHELGRREGDSTTYAHAFQDANGPVAVGTDPDVSVVVDSSILALAAAPKQPMAERDLARLAIDVLTEEAASFLLRAVDVEAQVTDPSDLEL